jgi:hypothetical protein
MCATEILPKSKLFEMPCLMSGPLRVPLQDDAANQQKLAQLMAQHPSPIQSGADGELYFIPKPGGGGERES